MNERFDEKFMLKQLRFFYWYVESDLRNGDVWPGNEHRYQDLAESLSEVLDQLGLLLNVSPHAGNIYTAIESQLLRFTKQVEERLLSQELIEKDHDNLTKLNEKLEKAFKAAAFVPKEETEEIIVTQIPSAD